MAEINPDIKKVLQEHKINTSAGVLVLLGIYHGLDIESVCPEEAIKAVNLTHIVDRDYSVMNKKNIVWNMPLYSGEENSFSWVADWFAPFGQINKERRGTATDCIKRMKDFFAKNPEYRKEDVYKARDAYFKSMYGKSEYLKTPEKFIFEGVGTMKKSMLLQWCEIIKEPEKNASSTFKGIVHK